MPPRMYTGPKGGKFVVSTKNEKIYVPPSAIRWTQDGKQGNLWRVWLRDGTNMLFPALKE